MYSASSNGQRMEIILPTALAPCEASLAPVLPEVDAEMHFKRKQVSGLESRMDLTFSHILQGHRPSDNAFSTSFLLRSTAS